MILIDPDGRRAPSAVLLGHRPALRPATLTNGTYVNGGDGDAAARVVRDLGFIEVAPLREGVQVRLRPLLVSGPAATQLFFSLADMKPNRVVLVRFDDDRQQWRHEICGDWRHAFERLDALVFADTRGPAYVATEIDLAEIAGPAGDGLQELHALWERHGRKLDPASQGALRRLGLDAMSILVVAEDDDERFVFRHLGERVDIYGRTWSASAPGRDMEDQPDPVFAARMSANIRRTAALGRPLFHNVETVVRRATRTSVQMSYRRLALPWRTGDGQVAVSTTVLFDQYIEIAE